VKKRAVLDHSWIVSAVAEAQPDHSINQRAISVTNLVAVPEAMSDAKLFANRSALFANDAESAMIACSLL